MTIEEIYIFLAILIHCGCEKKAKIRDYWKISRYANDSEPTLGRYIGLRRFKFIWKFFTVSPNSLSNSDVFQDPILFKKRKRKRDDDDSFSVSEGIFNVSFFVKLESLASHIRKICKRVYTSGIHICINEVMCVFRGRSKHTTKLKNKSIKEGFKVWILAEHGFIWSWL
jgi:hypothetical protein